MKSDALVTPITGRRIFLATLTVLGVVTAFALLYRFYMVVFLFFIAFSLTVVFEPLVTWLHRRGVRRELSLILVYLLLAMALGLLLWSLVPMLVEQIRDAADKFPTFYANLLNTLRTQPVGLLRGIARVLPAEPDLPDIVAMLGNGDGSQEVDPIESLGGALRLLFAVISVFLMAYFWTMEGDRLLRHAILRAPAENRGPLRKTIAEIQGKINGYFRGQLVLCSVIGALSLVAYFAIGLPNALLLAVLMAFFEAVPLVGPILGAIPAVLTAASVAPDKVVWVIGAVVAIQVAESNLLVPRVMDKAVGTNAIVSLLAIAAFGALFGFAGALLAVPLAAILQILVSRLLFEPNDQMPEAATAASPGQRGKWAVLRHQAQELATDARKLARTDVAELDSRDERLLEEVEVIAGQLGAYLAIQEQHG